MPWCPKCKNEYVPGIKSCTECGCDLVDSLEEAELEAVTFGTEDLEETGRAETEEPEMQTQASVFGGSGVYQKPSEKAADFKSSAYVLLLVGAAGILLLVLILMGILPIRLAGMNRYLTGGVMGALFLLFLVMGVLSLRSSRQLLGKAAKEDELTKEILSWCENNLTAETLDTIFDGEEELPEEVRYFKRTLYMKERISTQFLNLDESYLEQLVDDYYQEIYG